MGMWDWGSRMGVARHRPWESGIEDQKGPSSGFDDTRAGSHNRNKIYRQQNLAANKESWKKIPLTQMLCEDSNKLAITPCYVD